MSPETSRSAQARRALEWPVLVWLTLVWVLLWGEFTVGNILAGVVISIAIIRVFPLPPIDFTGRVHPWRLAVLVYAFFRDLVLSSIQVAGIVLRFGYQPVNSVIIVPMRTRSDLALMMTSEIVSLVPGSLLIEVSRKDWTLQIHVIETNDADDVEAARQRVWAEEERVVRALGNAEDIARIEQPPPALPPARRADHGEGTSS
ncbi:Na+/H+ antiporter subunit E [Mumia zhuanghuii]|uniref:Na+/H+ antiporter subunit E n=2 Tax=Mumia TaxID=1546255 RepID=A0ABW1QJX0_9ACTN|nr:MULTISPECIES: Na+/H+ antiporter subunit E [Mumia]KAA1425286.1 Na+/H+ antiporter subunit E [Mumia zhuanghuii]